MENIGLRTRRGEVGTGRACHAFSLCQWGIEDSNQIPLGVGTERLPEGIAQYWKYHRECHYTWGRQTPHNLKAYTLCSSPGFSCPQFNKLKCYGSFLNITRSSSSLHSSLCNKNKKFLHGHWKDCISLTASTLLGIITQLHRQQVPEWRAMPHNPESDTFWPQNHSMMPSDHIVPGVVTELSGFTVLVCWVQNQRSL